MRQSYKKILFTIAISTIVLQIPGVAQKTESDAGQKMSPADSIKKVQEKLKEKSDSAEKAKKSRPIQVRKVYKYDRSDTAEHKAGIGDLIIIQVDNLDSLLSLSRSTNQEIRLYINGRKIDNITAGAPDKDNETLSYRLDRNSGNDKIFADILGAPPFLKKDFFDKDVKVSVGLERDFAIRTLSDGNNFTLARIHRGRFWLCCVLVVFYLFTVVVMAKTKGLLRDRTIDLSVIGIPATMSPGTYSLARFQMAFWFSLTIVSFFFIWLITEAYDIITPTILALIGISAGTTLSASVIDDSKKTELLNQTVALQNEKITLTNELSGLNATLQATPANSDLQNQVIKVKTRINEISPQVARNIAILTPQQSEGFFRDILRDVNGVTFHRVQLLVWTFVLGLIFLYSVWKSLSMPEFSATLLGLQGLTAGTYLGFKFPEKHA